ncbi:MAG: DUF896 domain-containing protein [Clostridiales bacterium]|nr:DUF896 domain-containing protein [Candidatus Crickella merdequi]
MEQSKIDRINELARKSKVQELTAEEKEEQRILRRQFIDDLRADLRNTLETIEFVDADIEKESTDVKVSLS